MKAMVLNQVGSPLTYQEIPIPQAKENQVLIEVIACAVCRTDLHILDGDLDSPKLPLVIGHQVVGRIVALGKNSERFQIGDLVGVPWLGYTCKKCRYCQREQENLCENAAFTGYHQDGGYAEFTVAQEDFCFLIPENYSPYQAAPLLCAGLIGYRALNMTGKAEKIGLYGFGAAAHIIAQVILHQGRTPYAFTRPGDKITQDFARNLGVPWAGGSNETPPEKLEAAIIFAPVGSLVPEALRRLDKGGTVVCAGIHMSEIPPFPYSILWEERSIRSVANLTRQDGEDFFQIAPKVPVKTDIHTYSLEDANQALDDLRHGRFQGAAVLAIK